jgi:hypothetical protein
LPSFAFDCPFACDYSKQQAASGRQLGRAIYSPASTRQQQLLQQKAKGKQLMPSFAFYYPFAFDYSQQQAASSKQQGKQGLA